jgi:hypothetical protein
VPERDVKDGIGCGRARAQAFQIFQIASLYLSPGGGQRPGTSIAARKTEHLVSCADKFRDNPGTDESSCTCYEDAHKDLSYLLTARVDERLSSH